jgi:hypothetical protein
MDWMETWDRWVGPTCDGGISSGEAAGDSNSLIQLPSPLSPVGLFLTAPLPMLMVFVSERGGVSLTYTHIHIGRCLNDKYTHSYTMMLFVVGGVGVLPTCSPPPPSPLPGFL